MKRAETGNRMIRIRRAKAADIAAIVAIEKGIFIDPWNNEGFLEVLYLYPGTFFVAEKGSRIVGFICSGLENTGEEIYGHVMNFATCSESQGQGIGTMLLKRTEYECMLHGASAMQLEARVSNTKAQKFYQNAGYTQVFIISSYYPDAEDAIVMMKWE